MASPFIKNSNVFRFRLIGAERIPATFAMLSKSTRESLKVVCSEQAKAVQGRAKMVSQSVLNSKTGKTHRSFKVFAYNTDDGKVGAIVKTNWYIARFWEMGFGHGKSFLVKGHIRKSGLTSSRTQTRWVQVRASKKKTTIKQVVVSQAESFVKPHYRVIDQKARPSLLPAFNAQRSEIRAAIEQAIRQVR